MSSDLFLVLPSNSNLNLFKNNTLSEFTVHFNRNLPIDSTYEVALQEIFFPFSEDNSIQTNKGEDTVNLRIGKKTTLIPLVSRAWDKKVHFIQDLNHLIETALENKQVTEHPYLKYHDNLLKSYNEEEVEIELSYSLSRKLRNNHLDYIYVYANVVEPSFVGDGYVKLLRLVDVSSCIEGRVCSVIYNTPQYHPVCIDNPQTIEINLRTSLGDLVRLKGEGSTVLVLHARKRLTV